MYFYHAIVFSPFLSDFSCLRDCEAVVQLQREVFIDRIPNNDLSGSIKKSTSSYIVPVIWDLMKPETEYEEREIIIEDINLTSDSDSL